MYANLQSHRWRQFERNERKIRLSRFFSKNSNQATESTWIDVERSAHDWRVSAKMQYEFKRQFPCLVEECRDSIQGYLHSYRRGADEQLISKNTTKIFPPPRHQYWATRRSPWFTPHVFSFVFLSSCPAPATSSVRFDNFEGMRSEVRVNSWFCCG